MAAIIEESVRSVRLRSAASKLTLKEEVLLLDTDSLLKLKTALIDAGVRLELTGAHRSFFLGKARHSIGRLRRIYRALAQADGDSVLRAVDHLIPKDKGAR